MSGGGGGGMSMEGAGHGGGGGGRDNGAGALPQQLLVSTDDSRLRLYQMETFSQICKFKGEPYITPT